MTFRLITQAQVDAHLALADPLPPQEYLDVIIPTIEESLETFLNRPLEYVEDDVEWLDASDDETVLISRHPVESVSEVRYDARGGFGQDPDTFGDETILEPGREWCLKLDGVGQWRGWSESGILLRRDGRMWNGRAGYERGLLGVSRVYNPGCIKVTFTGGYRLADDDTNRMPGVIPAAIMQLASVWYASLTNIGVVSSESSPNYSYSQILGFNLGDNQFASVRQMLQKYRAIRIGAAP